MLAVMTLPAGQFGLRRLRTSSMLFITLLAAR